MKPQASLLWFLYVGTGMGCPEIGALFRRDSNPLTRSSAPIRRN